jgi:hypothetical protein
MNGKVSCNTLTNNTFSNTYAELLKKLRELAGYNMNNRTINGNKLKMTNSLLFIEIMSKDLKKWMNSSFS